MRFRREIEGTWISEDGRFRLYPHRKTTGKIMGWEVFRVTNPMAPEGLETLRTKREAMAFVADHILTCPYCKQGN